MVKEAERLDDMVFSNTPVIDFSRENDRTRMQEALDDLDSRLGFHYNLKIGSDWFDTEDQMESINPSIHSQVIGTVSKANEEHAARAVTAAKDAYNSWSQISAQERGEFLKSVADQMSERIYDLSALIILESGKTWREAYGDVNEAIDFLNFYRIEMNKLDGEKLAQDVLGEENVTSYISKGVVGVIAPWNFPLAILTGMTSAALVTGNTVVMKPAEDSSLIAGELMKMFENVGLPDGVLNYVPGDGKEVGGHLVRSPDVNMIAFTGSREVGLEIYEEISKVHPGQRFLRDAVLEMGGKNGIIIDVTGDSDLAIPGTLHSSFDYQGQKCSASSRVIVLDEIYDAFTKKLVESARGLKVGEARLPGTDVGPVINREAFDRIREYISDGIQQGGKVLLEGIVDDSNGFYIGPHIIEVDRNNVLAREEVFGPVLSVIRAKDFDDAMDILNDTDYGLTGGLYSRTPSNIEQFKREARVGNRYINRGITGSIVQRQPFGGFMMSGLGSKAGGENYLKRFMLETTTTENTSRSGYIPGIMEFVRTLK